MSMFDQNNASNEQQQDVEVKLEDIVGEGKKYATAEDLAKAYGHADSHITKVTAENAELRVKAEAKVQAEDFLKQLTEKQNDASPTNNAPTQNPSESNEQVDFEALLEKKLQERDSASSAKANQQKVMDALVAKYGNRAGEMFNAKAAELGADLDSLSASAPDLVLQAFGSIAPSASASNPTGDIRPNANNQGVTAAEGTKAHLMQLREAGKLSRQQYFAACQAAITTNSTLFNSHK